MASFVLSFFPLDVLDVIWNLIESVSGGFLTLLLPFSCSVLFLVTAAILESQTAKQYNGFIQETFWHKDGSISTKGSYDIVIFMFMLFLETVPGGHLG